MELLKTKIKMCRYYQVCEFFGTKCTEKNAKEICELFENFEKQKTEKEEE